VVEDAEVVELVEDDAALLPEALEMPEAEEAEDVCDVSRACI
jgi:hypothetical protein